MGHNRSRILRANHKFRFFETLGLQGDGYHRQPNRACGKRATGPLRSHFPRLRGAGSLCKRALTESLRNSMPLLVRSLAFVWLMALALFVMGPQAGSLDDDGDGAPDVPIVVSRPSLPGDISAISSSIGQSGRGGAVGTLGFVAPSTDRERSHPQGVIARYRLLKSQILFPLRC